MKTIFFTLMFMFFIGCSTTYIQVSKGTDKPSKYIAYHKNRFSNKSFDNLEVSIDGVKIKASKYNSEVNSEAITATGSAVKEGAVGIGDAVGSGAAAFVKKGL